MDMVDLMAEWQEWLLECSPDWPTVIKLCVVAQLGGLDCNSWTAWGISDGEGLRSWSEGLSDRKSMMTSKMGL